MDFSARLSVAASRTSDPDSLRAIALLDLVSAREGRKALDPPIFYLQTAARLARRPAPALSDLAAAYLVRAERQQNVLDLLEAIENAQRAVEMEPRYPAARFNLALALDRLGLDGEAAEAWRRYLMLDSVSGWAVEARERADVLAAAPAARLFDPAPGTPSAAVRSYVARAPQQAREHGWNRLLDEWGGAVERGDTARAGALLRVAEMIGEALALGGRDATLSQAVAAIRTRQGDPAVIRTLARAHQAYAAGRAALYASDAATAQAAFERVLALRAPSGSLQGWALQGHATAQLYAERLDAAAREARQLLARTDTLRQPALAGAARVVLGSALLRGRRHQPARDVYRAAAASFARAGEGESLGGAWSLVADAEFALGDADAAHTSMRRALALLRAYPGSVWLHNALSVSVEEAAGDGLLRAAARFQAEDVAVTRRMGKALYLAEALVWSAQLRISTGDRAGARRDVEGASAWIREVPQGRERRFLEGDLRLARAGVLLPTNPGRTAAVLDSVIADTAAPGTKLRLLQALVWRADARFALRDERGAMRDLDAATALLEEERDAVASTPLRMLLLESVREVFDRAVMLALSHGDERGALVQLERGRASFTAAGAGERRDRTTRWRVPRGSVALEYALVGDTLLVWTVADTTVRLARRTVDRAGLVRTVESTRTMLERRAGDAAVRPGLAALYDALVRPVATRLGDEGSHLVVVADGELAGVPFAALYDTASGGYLMEAHTLRFVSSLRDAQTPPRPVRPDTALFVANPAPAVGDDRALPPLPAAAREVAEIARAYPGSVVLSGTEAHRERVEANLRRAGVFHFAGHAVFDDERPEESFLLLAPGPGGSRAGRLTAGELQEAELRHVRLVVLSACETLRSRSGRSGGFAGLSGALLEAGAGGVAGSLWMVDDEWTRALMVRFHEAFRVSGDGPGALRAAQLSLLASKDPVLRSPAAWAGFRYAGN